MTSRRKFVALTAGVTSVAALQPSLGMSGTMLKTRRRELGFHSAVELAKLVADKTISATELLNYFIARIEKYDEKLNAVVVRDFERAADAAKLADEQLAQGKNIGPLHGVPMTVKESYNIAGLKTTWGFVPWKDMVAAEDATVVAAYKKAGAIVMGKTNVPVMLGDFQTYNDIYGQTSNPWDLSRGPGGSSGGAAAALAAGLCGLESGSDIGGSIRNPAHYCGVYGHKPTWGIVPTSGHQPPVAQASNGVDLAVVGPMARSADDLRQAMALITGPMELQSKGWRIDLPKPRAAKLSDLRIAFWHTEPLAPVDDEISTRSEELAQLLEQEGAKVSRNARPQVDSLEVVMAQVNLMQAVNMAGIPPELYAQNKKLAASFAADDMSMDAIFARAAVLSHNDWVNYDRQRVAMRFAWNRFFADWDVLICPISATVAFAHDHSHPLGARTVDVNGQKRSYFESSFWAGLITVPGLPSTVFPTGIGKSGLPIGLQAVSAEFDDYTCIEVARLIAQVMGGYEPPPGYVG
ncbi:MAG: amidase [Gammaproteobacteria bacterium]|nr:amidase [Gammaproteobacteria bacterium]